MEQEKIRIVDENRNEIGVATREEVHKQGYWHETFHCWFVNIEENSVYIQLRSPAKKDFPNLFDITAAGHLLAGETVEDGIREVHEELGIDVAFDKLVPLGFIKNSRRINDFHDNEICHVFLYPCEADFAAFTLQKEEVAGIVKADFQCFYEFWLDQRAELKVDGFQINEAGEKLLIKRLINKNGFVPQAAGYYDTVVKRIEQKIN